MRPEWVEHRVAQARRPEPAKPDVTTPEWIAWFERAMRDQEIPFPPPPTPPPEDVEPVPVAAPKEAAVRRRRTPVVAVAAALVVLLGLGAWWWTGRSDRDPAPQARPVNAVTRPHQPPPVPVPLSPGDRHTQVRVLASGDLAVQEWLRGPEGSLAYVRYRLNGALERTGTRALAHLAPVDVGHSTDRTIDVVGATVLALACTTASEDTVPVPCGADADEQGWRLVGPAATPDAEVLVQLDLPG